MNAATLALVAGSVMLNASAQVAMRKTMLAAGSPADAHMALPSYALSIGLDPWFLLGMGCYVVSLVLWLMVLAKVEVSMAYPLGALAYVITAAAGYFYLHEHVGPARLAGIGLIILGIAIVSRTG